jgi:hypothetical protein
MQASMAADSIATSQSVPLPMRQMQSSGLGQFERKAAMTTKLKKESLLAVQDWCKKQKMELVTKPRHVHPRSYIVGLAAPRCLIVARCWADSEHQTQKWNKDYPLQIIHTFDKSLKAGDWCITAYISTATIGEPIAIPIKGQK